jgi:hypothetical protein
VARRGSIVLSGLELLGVVTSHGPFRECYRPARKARTVAEPIVAAAAGAVVSAERMRATFSAAECAPALLQRELSGSGTEMVAVEGAAAVPL